TDTPAPRGGFPFNGRQTWLRLQRSGTTVTGYGSFDGTTWTVLGSASISLGSSTFVGLAVSSREAGTSTTARFLEYSTTVSPVAVSAVTDREPIGPATRRTGIVISEIMYHPKPPPGVTNTLKLLALYNA